MRSETPFSEFAANAERAVQTLKAMANQCRLLVLCYLIDAGELSVGELVNKVGISQSALSQHLAKLREDGLVTTRKESQTVYYRVCDPKAGQLIALLHDLFCPELGRKSEHEETRS